MVKCRSLTNSNVRISFIRCSAIWKCANGSPWPFLQLAPKILRIPIKDLNSEFPLSSCSPAYRSVLGNTNVLMWVQFVLEPLLERLICVFFCQCRAIHECAHQLLLCSFLCNSLAWQFSQICRQLSWYLNWSPLKESTASGLTEQYPQSGWKSNCS